MTRFSNEHQERIKRTIQDTVALDPLISLRKIQTVLEKRGLKVADLHYIDKLRKKIHKEALVNVDRSLLAERIAQSRERHRLVTEELTRIGFGSADKPTEPGTLPPLPKDKIAALKAIVVLDLAMLKVETEAGIYEKKLDEKDIEEFRYKRLTPERLNSILDAMEAWNYTPPIPEELKTEYRIIEAVVAEPMQQLDAPQENGNTSTEPTTQLV